MLCTCINDDDSPCKELSTSMRSLCGPTLPHLLNRTATNDLRGTTKHPESCYMFSDCQCKVALRIRVFGCFEATSKRRVSFNAHSILRQTIFDEKNDAFQSLFPTGSTTGSASWLFFTFKILEKNSARRESSLVLTSWRIPDVALPGSTSGLYSLALHVKTERSNLHY